MWRGTRRQLLAVSGSAVLAGCSNLPIDQLSDSKLTFAADPLSIREEVVSATAFEIVADESFTSDQFSNDGDQSQPVEVTANMIHLEGTRAAVPSQLVAVAFPTIEVAEEQIDVAEEVDPRSLVTRAISSGTDLSREQKLRERSVRILSEERTVEVSRGSQVQNGESASVLLCHSTFTHAGDVIITFGSVSRMAYDDETVLLDLLGGLVRE